jgi:hypothetical protein
VPVALDELPLTRRARGKTATHVAMEAAKRGPIRVDQVATDVPVTADGPQIAGGAAEGTSTPAASHRPQRPMPGAHG